MHPLEVHILHCLVHSFDYRRHVSRHLAHRHCCLDAARDSVHATGEAEEIEGLGLLPDRIRGVYPCSVSVSLLQCLRDTNKVREATRCYSRAKQRRDGR